MKEIELSYTEDGQNIEVLVSAGYGAGWSTWEGGIEYAVDKRIIDFFKAHMDEDGYLSNPFFDDDEDETTEITVEEDDLRDFFTSIGYNGRHLYFSGLYDCKIVTVPVGTKFRIAEYDGAERIEIFSEDDWFTAYPKPRTY